MFRLFLLSALLVFVHSNGAEEFKTEEILPRLDPALQKEFYQTLESLDSLFKEKKITYWATAGSLLGAIRHHEMIPWDDDIDIALFIDDLGKVIALRPEFEKRGLVLLVKRDYAKIFPKEGKRIPHPEGGYYSHRYPFVDLFFMQHEKGKIVHASQRLRKGFENDWLQDDIFTEGSFGPLTLLVPLSARSYLERMYGDDCWEVAYADYDHALEKPRERVNVKIRQP